MELHVHTTTVRARRAPPNGTDQQSSLLHSSPGMTSTNTETRGPMMMESDRFRQARRKSNSDSEEACCSNSATMLPAENSKSNDCHTAGNGEQRGCYPVGTSAALPPPAGTPEVSVRWRRKYWMTDLAPYLQDRAMTNIFLVGTHNSATYGVSKASKYGCDAPDVLRGGGVVGSVARFFSGSTAEKWGKCQKMRIRDQLAAGVRYFDLRVALVRGGSGGESAGVIYVTHGKLSVPLSEVVKDVQEYYADAAGEVDSGEFLESSSGEGKGAGEVSGQQPRIKDVVILDFQHIFDVRNEELESLVLPVLAPIAHLVASRKFAVSTRLCDLWRSTDTSPHHSDRSANLVKACRVFVLIGRPLGENLSSVHDRNTSLLSPWLNENRHAKLIARFTAQLLPTEWTQYKERPRQTSQYPISSRSASVTFSAVVPAAAAAEGGWRQLPPPRCLFVTQAILTPVPKQVVCSTFAVGSRTSRSIKDLAAKVNPEALQWFVDRNSKPGQPPPPCIECDARGNNVFTNAPVNLHRNILLLDYPEIGRAMVKSQLTCSRADAEGTAPAAAASEELAMDAVEAMVYLNMLHATVNMNNSRVE